ncbi:MAG: hypothetical protein HY319_07625 [Armatimonadetes bacterium]|nr:hypothetical protein [Armatimonadota bacterium]
MSSSSTRCGAALLALWVLLSPAVVAGDIEGTVRIQSRLGEKSETPKHKRITRKNSSGYTSQELEASGHEKDQGKGAEGQEEEHVILHLVDPGGRLGAHPSPKESNIVDQANKQFVPHVYPVVKGSTVTFTNKDRFFHHIFSVSPGRDFTIQRHIRSQTRTFDKPGAVEIFCGIHPRMNAYLYVVENDYFTTPFSGGKYALRNIPAGKYTLRAWHPRLEKPVDFPVEVPEKGTVKLDLVL